MIPVERFENAIAKNAADPLACADGFPICGAGKSWHAQHLMIRPSGDGGRGLRWALE